MNKEYTLEELDRLLANIAKQSYEMGLRDAPAIMGARGGRATIRNKKAISAYNEIYEMLSRLLSLEEEIKVVPPLESWDKEVKTEVSRIDWDFINDFEAEMK